MGSLAGVLIIILFIVLLIHLSSFLFTILMVSFGEAAFNRKITLLAIMLPIYVILIESFSGFWQMGVSKISEVSSVFSDQLADPLFLSWYIPYTILMILFSLLYLTIWRARRQN
ncbi:hypothetical protein [Paenibacillus amylolyticus]|uniref:hypothetical protein n=1 Tax=Paenibacillus amylolyticus TaxID=1451 RepID=UPI0033992B17